MTDLDKYTELKMHLPLLGYDTMEELASKWGCTVQAIRMVSRGQLTSAKISSLIDEAIKEGDRKFQKHREAKLQAESN